MPLLYSSQFSDVVGKILIDPISRVITLYIHQEDAKLNVMLRALIDHLTTLHNYIDIDRTNPLHTDQIHCCAPDPLLPSHTHVGFREAITPESLHRFFNEITQFESNPKAIQAAIEGVEDSLPYVEKIEFTSHQSSSFLQQLFRKKHFEYIRPSDTQRIEKAYSLGLDEVSANLASIAIYSFCLAAIPNIAERGVKKCFKNRNDVDQWAKGAKYFTQAALLFYFLGTDTKFSMRVLFAIVPALSLATLNQNQQPIVSTINTFITAFTMMYMFLCQTYSTTALNTVGTLAGSFIISKLGIWLTDKLVDSPKAPSTQHLRMD